MYHRVGRGIKIKIFFMGRRCPKVKIFTVTLYLMLAYMPTLTKKVTLLIARDGVDVTGKVTL